MKILRFGFLLGATIFLIPGIMLAIWFFKDLSEEDFSHWTDAVATIEEVWISREEMGASFDRNLAHGYFVRHSYIISFETASGRRMRIEGSQLNSGNTNLQEIPQRAYMFYSPGDTANISYNPAQPDQFKFGTTQELFGGRLVEPVILSIFAAPGLIIMLVSWFRKKPGDRDIILPKRIKIGKAYDIDEVLETLKRETDLPEPYIYKGPIGGSAIYIPGDGGCDIQVLIGTGNLTITNGPRPEGALGRAAAEYYIGPVYYRSNQELFNKVVNECRRLFS